MTGDFPSWQTTLILDATHWHRGDSEPPRGAVATVHLRAREDGALMVTVSNGEAVPETLFLMDDDARILNRLQDLIFGSHRVGS